MRTLLPTASQARPFRRAFLPAALLLLALPHVSRGGEAEMKTLWQVGQADESAKELALGPNQYNGYSEDGFFAGNVGGPHGIF